MPVSRHISLPASRRRLLQAIGAAREWFWSDPERHQRGRLDLVTARREIARAYAEEREATIRPFPGAIETLVRLREQEVRMALITNGRAADQRRKITTHTLEALFDCILIEEEFGAGKPDPRVYLHALSQLEAAPARAWMVGDNLEWDVAAPQRLGIFGVWHDFAGTGLPPACPITPDRIIRSLPELLTDA